MKYILVMLLLAPVFAHTQIDSAFILKIKSLDTADILRTDTVSVPDDALTRKIKELFAEKKGLTVNTILRIKIAEEQQKDTAHSKEYYDRLLAEITSGKTARLIENSQINLYRRNFSEPEVDELIRFYKTTAGQKMNQQFLLLMVQVIKDAEQLVKLAASKMK